MKTPCGDFLNCWIWWLRLVCNPTKEDYLSSCRRLLRAVSTLPQDYLIQLVNDLLEEKAPKPKNFSKRQFAIEVIKSDDDEEEAVQDTHEGVATL